jgi:hypothetical protein
LSIGRRRSAESREATALSGSHSLTEAHTEFKWRNDKFAISQNKVQGTYLRDVHGALLLADASVLRPKDLILFSGIRAAARPGVVHDGIVLDVNGGRATLALITAGRGLRHIQRIHERGEAIPDEATASVGLVDAQVGGVTRKDGAGMLLNSETNLGVPSEEFSERGTARVMEGNGREIRREGGASSKRIRLGHSPRGRERAGEVRLVRAPT